MNTFKNNILGLLLVLVLHVVAKAQTKYSEHTLKLNSDFAGNKAKIDELFWLAGNWQGTENDIISEEQWAKPIGNTMMGMYRMVAKNEAVFYELMLLEEDSLGVMLKLKHFNKNLKGWEEKEHTGVAFRLIKTEGQTAYFDGITYTVTGKNLIVYLGETNKEGQLVEEIFRMKKQK
jgi:hypothetical protein